MRMMRFSALAAAAFLAASGHAQVPLNTTPARVVGHRQLPLSTANPNLVEGRELYGPQGVAVDMNAVPPAVYVSDTGNHRVLGWKNAREFSNGAPADIVIGQKDGMSTFAQGPGTAFSAGLNSPTGIAVRNGDLYVVDSGNNRILRFPKAATAPADQFPDLVIGQPNFNSRLPNQGGSNPTERTLYFSSSSAIYRARIVFDASGNLWVADPGNHRVLRYPASALAAGSNGPAADLILGQADFSSVAIPLPANVESQQVKDRVQLPSGLAFDAAGRLYVSDGLSRVLVFTPPIYSGKAAARIMGVILPPDPEAPPPDPRETLRRQQRTRMAEPDGIVILDGNSPAVIDSLSHRMLVFDPFEQWAGESTLYSPMARTVLGQAGDFSSIKANNGQPEPSGSAFASPVSAVLAGGELYVADSGNNRVLVLPCQGTQLSPAVRVLGQLDMAFGSPNLLEGREFDFVAPTGRGTLADAAIVVDEKSDPPRLYVADVYNNRVLGFRDARRVKPGDKADLVIGQPDMFRGVCNYPNGDVNKPTQSSLCFSRAVPPNNAIMGGAALALDEEGNLYVADSGNGRVLRFPSPFQHQGTLPQADLVLGQAGFTSSIFDPSARTMGAPSGLVFLPGHGLLVSDQLHNRVLFFPQGSEGFTSGMAASKVFGQVDFSSTAASSKTGKDAEDNRMFGPRHIAADTDARLYVADTGNSRVLIFDTLARTPHADAHAVVVLDGLRSPRGIYVSAVTGEAWVTDTGNSRTVRYPRFDQIPLNNFQPTAIIPGATATLAVAQDQFGNLFVADAANRVAIHYPGLAAVNAASYSDRPLAPGMIATIYPAGGRFGDQTLTNAELPNPLPLPTELADIQVLVNDTPAPLFLVSPQQINLMVPTTAPSSGLAEFTVMRKSTGQILGSASVQMNAASPGIFVGSGKQAAALNQDGTFNTPNNPAARGSVISLFGTGPGPVAGAPADGEVAQGITPTSETPRVFIEPCYVDEPSCESAGVLYSGLAPGQVGLWQINVEVPKAAAPGPALPVVVFYRNIPSNPVTIAVKE